MRCKSSRGVSWPSDQRLLRKSSCDRKAREEALFPVGMSIDVAYSSDWAKGLVNLGFIMGFSCF